MEMVIDVCRSQPVSLLKPLKLLLTCDCECIVSFEISSTRDTVYGKLQRRRFLQPYQVQEFVQKKCESIVSLPLH